jgi:hypothetical protein
MASWWPDRSHSGDATCPGFDSRAKLIRPRHLLLLQVTADLIEKMVWAMRRQTGSGVTISACDVASIHGVEKGRLPRSRDALSE